ncbi:MAG: CorA family divalent cation transporter, partial [Oscillospiraceae bacterium]
MVNFYKTKVGKLEKIDSRDEGCWVSMIAPTENEMQKISAEFNIDVDALRAAMDTYERSRIEIDDNYTMILVNIPTVEEQNSKELYNTIPLAIIVTDGVVITVCSEDTSVLRQFTGGKVRDFYTNMKSRFILQ